MKNFFQWFLVIGAIIVLVFLLSGKSVDKDFQVNNIKDIKIGGVELKVELALIPEAQSQGLSGRNELKENEGMLFVFENLAKHNFWMKDMNFPIDMIWLDENMKIIYLKKDARPESYLPADKAGPESFGPDKNSKYVLEVVSGFSEKNNLKEGDRMKF